MTINAQTPRFVAAGNGTRGPFTLSVSGTAITYADSSELVFKRYDDEDALVGTLVEGVDFSITVDAVETGDAAATFTLDSTEDVLASGESVIVERITPKTSDFALASTGGIFAAAIDKITRILQELFTGLTRRVETHPAYSGSAQLPLPEAGAFLGWNGTSDALTNLDGVTETAIASVMVPIVQAASLEAARDALFSGDALEAALTAETIGASLDALLAARKAVATYAALTALTTATGLVDGAVYKTAGRLAANDGGEGDWLYNAASSATADACTILALDGGGSGRFFRLFVGPVRSKWRLTGSAGTTETAGINAFFALAGTYPLYIDAGTYDFDAALTAITGTEIYITGDRERAEFRYVGASTNPGDLITFGSIGTARDSLTFRDVELGSTTTLTGGYALKVIDYTNLRLDIIINGGGKLYKGLRLDNVDYTWLGDTDIYSISNRIEMNDCLEVNCQNAELRPVTVSAGTHIVVGGGCGGVYFQDCNSLYGAYGVVVDTSLARTTVLTGATHSNTTIDNISSTASLAIGMSVTGSGIPAATYITAIPNGTTVTINQNASATASGVSLTFFNGNTQLCGGNAVFDTPVTASMLLNDTTGNPLSKHVSLDNAWLTSATSGSGLVVTAWTGGFVDIPGATIKNSSSHGISNADATVRFQIGAAADISYNGGYGISSSVNVTMVCAAVPHHNTSGAFTETVARETADAITWTVTIADGANSTFRNGADATKWSGTFTIANNTNGAVGLFALGGGGVTEVADTATVYEVSATPVDTGVAFDTTVYKVFNATGAQVVYLCKLDKIRPSV